ERMANGFENTTTSVELTLWAVARQSGEAQHEALLGLKQPSGRLLLSASYQCTLIHRISNFFHLLFHLVLSQLPIAAKLDSESAGTGQVARDRQSDLANH